MSTWSTSTLRCPACRGNVEARIARGAHVGRAPHVRAAVLARALHRFPCGCGSTLDVDTSFEYVDFERHQLFLVGRDAQRATWPALEAELRESIERALHLGSPLANRFVGSLVSRLVFGLEELREKLVLADAALDDGLVECIKVRAVANQPSLHAGRLVVDAVNPDDSLVCIWVPRSTDPPARIELPASWTRAALDDRASLEARFPALFAGGYVAVDRLRAV